MKAVWQAGAKAAAAAGSADAAATPLRRMAAAASMVRGVLQQAIRVREGTRSARALRRKLTTPQRRRRRRRLQVGR